MTTVRLPPQFCPVCFTMLDAATNMTSEGPPVPGDFTICIGCRSILKFGPEMGRELSSLEAVPAHSRFAFAKMLRVMGEMPPPRRKDNGRRDN
jgi:hypothetical protein